MKLVNLREMQKTNHYRILVLEDDFELSLVIERVFKGIDPSIVLDWATSAEAAIELLERTIVDPSIPPYDLIIADIFLDGKSTGIDFWRNCQDILPDTPVLITSALSLERFFATVGRQSICPPYLQKPFTLNECKQAFETMLRYSVN